MTFYLDTSVLVAAHTDEARTRDVQDWLERQRPKSLAISAWVIAEFSSALSKKQRIGQIDAAYRAKALAAFNALASNLEQLEIAGSHFHVAARFADQSELGLRAGDALHLAVSLRHGAALHTLDARLAAAGPALGAKTVLL